MPGGAAAGQRDRRARYRRARYLGARYLSGMHRALPSRHVRRALLAAGLWLLLPAAALAEAAPTCLPSGRVIDADGREFPTVQRAEGTLACMPTDIALGREVHERFASLLPSHAFETHGELTVNGATTADLYEALHAISTLQGIRYFSVLHRGERELFRTAHAIDGRGAATDDPVPSPDGHGVAYALVDDASFGRAPYRLEYRTADDTILLIVSNLLPLKFLVVPLIDAERLLIALLITPRGPSAAAGADGGADGAAPGHVYGLVAAVAPTNTFLEPVVEASLRSRLAAMQDWILARAAAVARPEGGTGSEAGAGDAGTAQG